MASKYTQKLQDQRVLVIGGTSGIGYAVAEGAIEFGAHVIVASSKQANVDTAVKQLKTAYPDAADRIDGHICDYASNDIEATLVKVLDFATKNNTIKLDHIVDTAGAPPFPLDLNTIQPSQIDAVVRSRVIPKMILSKLARTYVKDSYTSSITFTSGALVTKPTPGFGVHASIGGGDGLARGMAKDLAPIRANVVAPGAIRTPLLEKLAGSGDVQAMLDRFASATLLKRVGQPEDVAESYLAAMKNHYQTGTVTHVEGGYYLV